MTKAGARFTVSVKFVAVVSHLGIGALRSSTLGREMQVDTQYKVGWLRVCGRVVQICDMGLGGPFVTGRLPPHQPDAG